MKQRLAFMFPGQGSQYASMSEMIEQQDIARPFLELYEKKLSYNFCPLNDQELSITLVTQPALYTMSCIHLELLRQKGFVPYIVAGHSLGEYAALYAADVLSFEEGLELVSYRGKLMHEVSLNNAGKMAAIIGLELKEVMDLCWECRSAGIVEAVNINSEKQIVISGENYAVTQACELAKTRGARRALILPVSAPFHSSLMQQIRSKFEDKLYGIPFRTARYMLVQNVDACVHQHPERIRENLILQLYHPVLWMDSMNEMVIRGAEKFIEVGPKKVLTSLAQSMGYSAQSSEEMLKSS